MRSLSASKGALALATCLGLGHFPVASGTLATAAALPLAWGLHAALGGLPGLQAWYWPNLALVALLFLPSVRVSGEACDQYREHDSHKVVIDEVLGTLCALAFLPSGLLGLPGPYVWAFGLFRLFDIWKPFPIRQSQVLPRGWGVVVDDVLAGLLSGVLLALAAHSRPGWVAW